MKQSLKDTIKRLCKHTCFSLSGTATDTLVLWICSSFFLSNNYFTVNILSPLISFECGNFINFLVATRYVWGDRMAGKTRKQFIRSFLIFNLSYSTVFFVKMGLLLAIEAVSDWDVVICNLIAVTFAGLINFFVNDKIIFREKKTGKPVVIKPTEFSKAIDSPQGAGEVADSEVFDLDLTDEAPHQ